MMLLPNLARRAGDAPIHLGNPGKEAVSAPFLASSSLLPRPLFGSGYIMAVASCCSSSMHGATIEERTLPAYPPPLGRPPVHDQRPPGRFFFGGSVTSLTRGAA